MSIASRLRTFRGGNTGFDAALGGLGVVLPKFGSELIQRTGTGRTEPTV